MVVIRVWVRVKFGARDIGWGRVSKGLKPR